MPGRIERERHLVHPAFDHAQRVTGAGLAAAPVVKRDVAIAVQRIHARRTSRWHDRTELAGGIDGVRGHEKGSTQPWPAGISCWHRFDATCRRPFLTETVTRLAKPTVIRPWASFLVGTKIASRHRPRPRSYAAQQGQSHAPSARPSCRAPTPSDYAATRHGTCNQNASLRSSAAHRNTPAPTNPSAQSAPAW